MPRKTWTVEEVKDFASRIRQATRPLSDEPESTLSRNWEGAKNVATGLLPGLWNAGGEFLDTLLSITQIPTSAIGAAYGAATGDAQEGAKVAASIYQQLSPLGASVAQALHGRDQDKQGDRAALIHTLDAPFVEGLSDKALSWEWYQGVKSDVPAITSAAESFGRTLNRVTDPSQYAKALEEGTIVPTVLEDVFNFAPALKGVGRSASTLGAESFGRKLLTVGEKIESIPAVPFRAVKAPFNWGITRAVQSGRVDPSTAFLASLGDPKLAKQFDKTIGPVRGAIGDRVGGALATALLQRKATKNLRGLLLTEPGARAAAALKDVDIEGYMKLEPSAQEAAVAIASVPDAELLDELWKQRAGMRKLDPEVVAVSNPLNISDEGFKRAIGFLRGAEDEQVKQALETVQKVQDVHAATYLNEVGKTGRSLDIAPEDVRAKVREVSALNFDDVGFVADETGAHRFSIGLDSSLSPDEIGRLQSAGVSALTGFVKDLVENPGRMADLPELSSFAARAIRLVSDIDSILKKLPEGTDRQRFYETLVAKGFEPQYVQGLFEESPHRALTILRSTLKEAGIEGADELDRATATLLNETPGVLEHVSEYLRRELEDSPEFWSPTARTLYKAMDTVNKKDDFSFLHVAERFGEKQPGYIPIQKSPILSDEQPVSLGFNEKMGGGFSIQSEPLEFVRSQITDIAKRYLGEAKREVTEKAALTPLAFLAHQPSFVGFLDDLVVRSLKDLGKLIRGMGKHAPDEYKQAWKELKAFRQDKTPWADKYHKLDDILSKVPEINGVVKRDIARVASIPASRQGMWALAPETMALTGALESGGRLVPKAVADAIRDIDWIPPRSRTVNVALKAYDLINRSWVGATLPLRPAWNVGNLASNLLVMSLYPKSLLQLPKVLFKKPETVGEFAVTGQGIADAALSIGRAQRLGAGAESYGATEALTSTPNIRRIESQTYGPIGRAFESLVQAGAKVNTIIDDATHRAIFEAYGKEMPLEEGIRFTNRVAGDMRNLSRYEREMIRRVSLFYPWIRHMIQMTGHLVQERPLMLAGAGWVQQNWGHDQSAFPEWARGGIQIGDKLFRVPWNPFEVATESNPLMSTDVFMVSPLIQAAGAFGGVNLSRGREFQAAPGEPDRGPLAALNAFAMQWPQYRMAKQAMWPDIALYDTGRPRFSRGAPVPTAARTDTTHLLLNYLTGISELNKDTLVRNQVSGVDKAVSEYRARIRQEALERHYAKRRGRS